jgi:hypothetical protein
MRALRAVLVIPSLFALTYEGFGNLRHPHLLRVSEHLQHLSSHLQPIAGPAIHVPEQRRQPWWR